MPIKLRFRPSTVAGKQGRLYYLITFQSQVRNIATDAYIDPSEWDTTNQCLKELPSNTDARNAYLQLLADRAQWTMHLYAQLETGACRQAVPNFELLLSTFCSERRTFRSLFDYMLDRAYHLEQIGRHRSSVNCMTTLNRFRQFRHGCDLSFARLDHYLLEEFEGAMRQMHLARNTSSFYMRQLRTCYNLAVSSHLTPQRHPFTTVYTGIDRTAKRAITLDELRSIKALTLTRKRNLRYARDMFLLSFYLRGMSFIDMAFLKKSDLCGNRLTYHRNKTGQTLTIGWEPVIDELLAAYPSNDSPYLLPIILRADGTEREQYVRRMAFVNRNLKRIGQLAGLSLPLSLYVARHSWATIALQQRVAISVISEALGHDSEQTTHIYLASIHSADVDKANHRILEKLGR